jgi:uncharacterized membrane protein YgdD (TMEM256/DUF423 family)
MPNAVEVMAVAGFMVEAVSMAAAVVGFMEVLVAEDFTATAPAHTAAVGVIIGAVALAPAAITAEEHTAEVIPAAAVLLVHAAIAVLFAVLAVRHGGPALTTPWPMATGTPLVGPVVFLGRRLQGALIAPQ